MEGETRKARKGPVPRLDTVKTTISVEADILEWGKNQPGGFSDLVRRLVRGAMEEAEKGAPAAAI